VVRTAKVYHQAPLATAAYTNVTTRVGLRRRSRAAPVGLLLLRSAAAPVLAGVHPMVAWTRRGILFDPPATRALRFL